ncbi:MAG: hypothetical protein JSW34_08035 [Candidatus Zixiibacteriota bacterium]|nr:MAG: hypothetical protein JSW34_08035 [candidate division Zixibacteria bacterium]
MSSAGAAAAVAAARAREARRRQEEEDMTPYNDEDLNGWEFKIVRANTRKFRSYDEVRKLCEEEARAGWELVEKFDDSRIRFKRKIEHRARDRYLDIDPYRVEVGIGQGKIAILVVGLTAVILAAVLLFAFLSRH